MRAGAADTAQSTVNLGGELAVSALGDAVLPVTGKAGEAYVAVGAAGQAATLFVQSAAALDFPNPFTVGGLTFGAGGLKVAYDPAGSKFSLFGTSSFPLGGGTGSIARGDAANPGVVVADGSLTTLNFGVTSNLEAGGVTFATDSLGGKYDAATKTITVTGGASFELSSGNTVAVNFGGEGTSGLVAERRHG